MRQEYFDPIERFPERMDQFLDIINRVCHVHFISSISILSILVIFITNWRNRTTRQKTCLIFFASMILFVFIYLDVVYCMESFIHYFLNKLIRL